MKKVFVGSIQYRQVCVVQASHITVQTDSVEDAVLAMKAVVLKLHPPADHLESLISRRRAIEEALQLRNRHEAIDKILSLFDK